ncbi:MAG: thiolase family protein [Pigmentiphaga sp.]|uniref:thiolase family protein n=1 Tax=Pigmentiphaga sp. TaxID=1977564 RepID=UPI0029A02140|nr:thiolase family protein [Pigmentiphaga sp.]MDX3906600.1 thiolase family protein [Pigmentiphaga sp.]
MDDVFIAGVGELPQGRSALPHTMTLHAELARRALEDAGLELDQVDAVLTVSPRSDPYLIHAAALAEYLGIQPAVAWTLEAGGAAPASMVETARGLIRGGSASTVLIVAADMPLGAASRAAYVTALAEAGPVHPELEVPYGPTVPAMFALVARAYAQRWGDIEEQLAAVAMHDRSAAADHPNAHHREPFDAAAYRASRMIADPLRLLDCAPVSDGGGALVLTGTPGTRRVPVRGAGFATGHMHLSAAASLTEFPAGRALDAALRQAGAARSDIDVALVYDCFTIAMLVNLEDLGLAARGQAGRDFLQGRFGRGGDLPVNTHGGLLSHGHPARAGGMGNVIEAVAQLRGEAGPRQSGQPMLAMAHGMGGVFATHGALLLGAPQ